MYVLSMSCHDDVQEFDYSKIRAKGARIKDLGGTAAGPDALRQLHSALDSVLEPLVGQRITVRAIADIMNMIGRCVQGGGVCEYC